MPKRKGKSKSKKTQINGNAGLVAAAAVLLFALLGELLGFYSWEDAGEKSGLSNPSINADVSVHFIDVGQGDSILIRAGESSVLIDAGEAEYGVDVANYIKSQNIDKLDYVISSHPHSDHLGGISEVLKTVGTQKIILPKLPDDMVPDTATYENFLSTVQLLGLKLTPAKQVTVYNLDKGATIEILAPVDDNYDNLNDFSVVVLLTHGDNTFLFTGDIESDAEKDLINAETLTDIDVLKVAHHGSNTSSKKKFLEAVMPEYAVIMCGDDNSYNHPNEKIVERIGSFTQNIYRTDLNGTVIFESDGKDLNIIYEK